MGAGPGAFASKPLGLVLRDFFGRPNRGKALVPQQKSPFPEQVMYGLAQALLTSDLGALNPGLLSKGFLFASPTAGPLRKAQFVEYMVRLGRPGRALHTLTPPPSLSLPL